MSTAITYNSTNQQTKSYTFKEALLKGLAPDRGLFMPNRIPTLSTEELKRMRQMHYSEIAYLVTQKFLKDEIADDDLLEITKSAYTFDIPLEKVVDNRYVMRLDQGPTASFKDFAARMMGRLMQHFAALENRELLILTATSGDTGSAIANAFYNLDNIKVVILYPEKEVTERQRKQMTTLHKNISIIAVDGKFDDCQAFVKQAFSDEELAHLPLSSANSINIGRLLPQSVYYFYAWSKLVNEDTNDDIIFSVPSGNFGNLMGGIIARQMGLPVKKFIAATNANDEFPAYLRSGMYKTIEPSLNCISSAMNVGHPSNMSRLTSIYKGIMNEKGEILEEPELGKIRNDIFSESISDDVTRQTIKEVYQTHKVLLEPHGAVAWAGLHNYLNHHPADDHERQVAVALETAHPAKFPADIQKALNIDPPLPESLKNLDHKEEQEEKIPLDYQIFKNYLKNNY